MSGGDLQTFRGDKDRVRIATVKIIRHNRLPGFGAGGRGPATPPSVIQGGGGLPRRSRFSDTPTARRIPAP